MFTGIRERIKYCKERQRPEQNIQLIILNKEEMTIRIYFLKVTFRIY